MSVATWKVQIAALAFLIPLTGLILWQGASGLVALVRLIRNRSRHPAEMTGLALGEPVLWQGSQGWRGVTTDRLTMLSLGAIGPALLTVWMWKLWDGQDILTLKLFWTAAAFVIFGGSLLMALLHGPEALRRLYQDLFGTMIVTDRRLAWLSPWSREVYREVLGTEMISVFMVESDNRRGWIGIVRKRGSSNVEDIDLRGVPQPSLALSALSRLVPPIT